MAKRSLTDGLRQKPNGVWERSEVISGKRRWFSSADPAEVWRKRNEVLGKIEEEQQEEKLGPLFETVADAYAVEVEKRKNGTQKSYFPAIRRAKERFSGLHMREIGPLHDSGISQFAFWNGTYHRI